MGNEPIVRDAKGRFVRGTCGKVKGTKHRFTKLFERYTDERGEEIAKRIMDAAMSGDSTILCAFLRYGLPRGRKVTLKGIDGPKPAQAILNALADGEITDLEAVSMAKILEITKIATDVEDLKIRLNELEK